MSERLTAWVVKDIMPGAVTLTFVVIGTRRDAERQPWRGARSRSIEGPLDYITVEDAPPESSEPEGSEPEGETPEGDEGEA